MVSGKMVEVNSDGIKKRRWMKWHEMLPSLKGVQNAVSAQVLKKRNAPKGPEVTAMTAVQNMSAVQPKVVSKVSAAMMKEASAKQAHQAIVSNPSSRGRKRKLEDTRAAAAAAASASLKVN